MCRLFLVLFLVFVFQTAPSFAKTFIVAVNNAPPYRIIENNQYSGFYIDIVKAIALRADLDLQFVNVPFKRGLLMMQHGEADMMLGPNKTPERQEYMVYFDEDLPREKKVIYKSETASDFTKKSELSGRSIAILRGASYAKHFDEITDITINYFSKHDLAFKSLKANRIDYLVQPEFLGDYLLKEKELFFSKATYFIVGKPSYFAISKKSELLQKKTKMEEILRDFKTSGKIAEIRSRYK